MPEKFKDSSLGQVPDSWRLSELGAVAGCLSGFAFPSSGFNDESGLRLIRIRDLLGGSELTYFRGGFEDRYLVQDGDLLVGMDGDFNAVEWSGGQALLNQRVCRVAPRAGAGLDARYLRHILQPILNSIHRSTPQTTVRHLAARALLSYVVRLPPQIEQRRIADILDTVDDAIRQTERVIAKLEQVKSGMLQDLLTRGIDDNGEVRDPDRHPEQFKDSPFGRIPKGWDVLPMRALSRAPGAYGSGAAARAYDPCLPRYVRITDIDDDGLLRTDSLASISEAGAYPYLLQEGDLCFARSGATVGKTYLYRPQDGRCAHAGYVIRFALDTERHRAKYVFYWTKGTGYARWLGRTLRQGAQPNVNAVEYASHLIAVPPRCEQDRIAGCLDSHVGRIMSEVAARTKLLAIKHALADDLLMGRVRVNAREGVPA